jgi:dCTP deaminase
MNETPSADRAIGVLNEKAILERLFVRGDLIIEPIIDLSRQLNPASLDIRLGARFQSQRTTSMINVDLLAEPEQIESDMLKVMEDYAIDPTEPYILHPGDFALGSTLEYVRLPHDLLGRLEGRSSWARKGLQVHATAGFIDPGYRGFITFELSNVSRMPIELYPMLRIGQLSFYSIGGQTALPYGRKQFAKYQDDLSVAWTRIHKDPEWAIIRRQRDSERKGSTGW